MAVHGMHLRTNGIASQRGGGSSGAAATATIRLGWCKVNGVAVTDRRYRLHIRTYGGRFSGGGWKRSRPQYRDDL